ncbi:MAG TPA: hypothetical protein VNO50_03115 [Pyrinomonadaceae bacterium]|nr:hypothetical protein [Pyrinomonadaceae bacterium]
MFELERLASLLTLTDIASIASLISLAVSIYVALSLRTIKKKYIFRLKAPEFMKALTKHASVLSTYGDDFENSIQEICDELAKVDVKLRTMKGRMRGASKKSVKQLRTLIKAYDKDSNDRQKFRLIYRGIQRVIVEVQESREELNLE